MKSKEELEDMNPSDTRKYLKDLNQHTKEVKALLKAKIKEIPSRSLSLAPIKCKKIDCPECPHGYAVRSSYRENGIKKTAYIGKYGEPSTLEKIKVLAEDRPELLDVYEKFDLTFLKSTFQK